MKKTLFVALFLLNHFAFAKCIYCKKVHPISSMCLPQVHFCFLQGRNSEKLKKFFIKNILKEFRKQKINNLKHCKHLQKIFLNYYNHKKDFQKDSIPQNVYEGRWFWFFNNYVVKYNEIILFNAALHYRARFLAKKYYPLE